MPSPGGNVVHAAQRVRLVQHLDGAGGPVRVEGAVFRYAIEHRGHVLPLRLGVGVGDVSHVQDDVGFDDLLQGGAEGRDRLRR